MRKRKNIFLEIIDNNLLGIVVVVLVIIVGGVTIVFNVRAESDDLTLGARDHIPYQVVSRVLGYLTKTDPTNTPPEYLVAGSQNVIINDLERVETRAGYALFGSSSTTAAAIQSDFSWNNSSGNNILLRQSEGTLYFYSTESGEFETLLEGFSTTSPIRYTTVWSGDELIDELLFVNASSTLWEWSGGQATLTATTSNTITLDDTASTSGRFLVNGSRQVRIKNVDGSWTLFTYTDQSGSQLTGVTPDPVNANHNTGALVVQEVRGNGNTPLQGYKNDVISVLQNQVFIGSDESQRVYISSNLSFTDYTFSSPRIPGEGALLTLDASTVGFISPDDEQMIIFSGKNRIYKMTFEISPGSTADREVPRVRPLLVSEGQGALSQELIGKIKQAVVWVSQNKELVELGQVEELASPQARSISDPIRPDFIAANFTNGEIEFWRNSIFITAPADGKVFIFDLNNRFWQPPQILPMRRLSVYTASSTSSGDTLYGHSNSVPETYELFTGLNDNGNPISFKAHFAYRNFDDRARLKQFNRLFTELFIAGNTIVEASILYEWKGAKTIATYELDGSDETFLFTPVSDASLGVNPLGTNPLGGLLVAGEDTSKYRRMKPAVPVDAFEWQFRFESDGDDQVWQILSHGVNVQLSPNVPASITK